MTYSHALKGRGLVSKIDNHKSTPDGGKNDDKRSRRRMG